MKVETVESLKRYYRDLSDKELLEEARYRAGISSRMVGAEGVALLSMTRAAVAELIRERGLDK